MYRLAFKKLRVMGTGDQCAYASSVVVKVVDFDSTLFKLQQFRA